MHAGENRFAVVEVVGALTEVEVEYVDGIDFFDLIVFAAYLDVLGDGFGNAIEHTLQIVELARELHLHDDDFALAVGGFYVDAVELGVALFLIAFAFEQFDDGDFFAQKHRHQAPEHGKVCLVAQHSLHCPVEPYVFVFALHSRCISAAKRQKKTTQPNDSRHFCALCPAAR